MARSSESIEEEIDRLYQGPLSEFITGRDSLAKRLRSSGDKEAGARVKSLQKPSVSAWAVNQVFWSFPDDFKRLLEAAQRVEEAQSLGAGSVREASQSRRKALSTLLKRAEMFLLQASSGANANILRRVETTLEALAAYGQSPPTPSPGRLVADIDPPGFGALSVFGLAPASVAVKRPPKVKQPSPAQAGPPPEDAARQSRLKDLQSRLEKALREVQILAAEVARAETARGKAEAEARIRRQAAGEAEERWRKAAEKAEKADEDLRQVLERVSRSKGEHQQARQSVEALQGELKDLLGS